MCCSNAAWKREEVPDHKFDFINVHEFHATNCTTRLQYFWLYLLFAKSVAVYIADIYTAIALLASNRWSGSILQSAAAEGSSKSATVLEVPFSIGKWVFTGCIIFSFLLLAWEARKSRAIIKSRDISYAFTNVMSQNWYALRSYDHFCFFCQIDNSKKKKDEFAFFIFFTFKGWKRLLLADAPRQVINAITLYSFGKSENWTTDLSVYFGGGILKTGVIITMLFTLVIWAGSALLLVVAAVMYIPLLCYIQGNLKEYVCHKVDKRIAELMKRKNRKRLAKEAEIARKEARGDFSHLKDKKTGKLTAAPLPQPTLPKVGLGDRDLYTASRTGGSDAGSIRGARYPPSTAASAWGAGGGGLARTAYPFQQSEPDSLHHLGGGGVGYAESVSSAEGFAGRGQPMGMGMGYAGGGESSLSLVGGGGGGAGGMRRQESWRSEIGGGVGGEEYGWNGSGGEKGWYAAAAEHGGGDLQRSQSSVTVAVGGVGYQPPSRQQLYDRTLDAVGGGSSEEDSHSHLAYAESMRQQYGGWEESRPRFYASQQQEDDPAEEGNFAGRGAGGKSWR